MPDNSRAGARPVLLMITELGGYPDFSKLYEACGYQVVKADSVRKAVKLIRQHKPSVMVAEFNFQSDFRDRTSSLETLLSSTQGIYQDGAEAKMVVFYEKEEATQYQRFLTSHDVACSLSFPIDESMLRDALLSLRS